MNQIGDVFVDIMLSEEESHESDVTQHPAESGSSYTDNKINKPRALSYDCIISASPLASNANAGFGPNIVSGCRARLIAIDATREPITVIDSSGTFPNMLIDKLTFTKTIKTGHALAFKISLKELIIIDNLRTVIPVAIPRAQAVVKKGPKTSKAPPDNGPGDDIDPFRTTINAGSNMAHKGNFVPTTPNNGF